MKRRPLIFVGSRQMMRELAVIAELNDIEVLGILDHHYPDQIAGDLSVIGDERTLLDPDNKQAQQWLRTCNFFPGNWHNGEQARNLPDLRLERINILESSGANVINLSHPDSSVRGLHSRSANYRIGRGVQIHPNVYHGVDNIEIGDYCAFMSGNTCAHDVRLGRNVLAAPNTYLYNCSIGDNSYIGIYSRMSPIKRRGPINIGNNVTVWNGAEVIKDIPDDCYYTSDGRIMSKLKDE